MCHLEQYSLKKGVLNVYLDLFLNQAKLGQSEFWTSVNNWPTVIINQTMFISNEKINNKEVGDLHR